MAQPTDPILLPTAAVYYEPGTQTLWIWTGSTYLWFNLTTGGEGFVPYEGATADLNIGNHLITTLDALVAGDITSGTFSVLQPNQITIQDTGYTNIIQPRTYTLVDPDANILYLLTYDAGSDKILIQGKTVIYQTTVQSTGNNGEPNTLVRNTDISSFIARGSYTYATTDTIANLQAFNGAEIKILVTDSARGGTFYYTTDGLTADSGTIFAATGRGGGFWVRSYDLIQPIDMAWFGVSGSNSTTVNEGIINTYMTANVSAYISFPSNLVDIENLTIRNTQRIRDTYTNTETFSGQRIGQSTAAGGYHALISPIQSTHGASGTARWYIVPKGILAPNANTAKIDTFGDDYESDPVNYRVMEHDFFNFNTNGNAGCGYLGVKGVGNYFGKFPALHFGFSDNTVVPMKLQYYDYADTIWHTPMLGRWYTGLSATTLDYCTASNHLYQAASTGICGNTVPSHTSGTVSDGGVNWTFIKDYSGSESNNFKASVIFGDKTSQGLTNIPLRTRVQFLGDSIVGNGFFFNYVDNTNTQLWSIGVPLNDNGLNITSVLGGYLRFNNVGQNIQNNGLSWLASPVTITNNSATPSVTGVEFIIFSNTNPTTVTSFANAQPYQRIIVQGGLNNNTTLQNNASIVLSAGENLVLASGVTIELQSNSSGVFYQTGNPIASATQGGLVSTGNQTFPAGNKVVTGNVDATASVTGSTTSMATNVNGGTGADARIGASNGTVNIQLIMRGTGFTTNANNAYVSVTGTGLLGFLMNGSQRMTLLTGGNFGIGQANPTAVLHLKAGTATASTAPLKLTSGTVLGTAEVGAIEYDGTDLFYTVTGPTRRTVANLAGTQTFINKTLTTPTITDGSAGASSIAVGTGSGVNYAGYSSNRAMFGYNSATTNASITAGSAKGFEVWVNSGAGAFAAGTNALTITSAGDTSISGNFTIPVGKSLLITEGANGRVGQTTLVAGTKAITITGITTSSRAFLSFVSVGGTVTTTWQYAGVCTANTLTITALTNAGATNTLDTSILNYEIIN